MLKLMCIQCYGIFYKDEQMWNFVFVSKKTYNKNQIRQKKLKMINHKPSWVLYSTPAFPPYSDEDCSR